MYLARKIIKHQTHYFIRVSYTDGTILKSKNVFDLGTDPSSHINYPGGNAYYYDEVIEETLLKEGVNFTSDDLDTIFWEFLNPEVKRVIKGFQRTIRTSKKNAHDTGRPIHLFDKRRMHFLKFAAPDQRNLNALPAKFFKNLQGKSRDEIEQYFISHERILHPRECKTYIYTIFDLHQYFRHHISAGTIPTIDQTQMDDAFLDALCQLNEDNVFWAGMDITDNLQGYLIKYLIMYFDYDFPRRSPFDDYLNSFRNRHRTYTPPQKVRVKMENAVRLFGTSWDNLKKMDLRTFTQLYRKLALKHHPDKGGDQETFIKLREIYEGLLRRKK